MGVQNGSGQATPGDFGDRNETLPPVEANGQASGKTVYVGGGAGGLHAFDAATGDHVWTYDTGDDYVESSPTVADGTVYVGSEQQPGFIFPPADGALHAVNATTGEAEWVFDSIDDWVFTSPTVVGGRVYVGGSGAGTDNTLYAVDAETGEEVWNYTEPSGLIRSSPTVADGTVYVGSGDSTLYAVDAETGQQEWAFEDPSGTIVSSPTVSDGTVYVGSNDTTLYAVDAETGTQEWAFVDPEGTIRSSPVVVGKTAYIGAVDGNLYAVNVRTGNERWSYDTGGKIDAASPTVVDNTVYIGSSQGALHAVDRGSGEGDWVFDEPDSWVMTPTVTGGTAYISEFNSGTVYAVDTATGEGEWTTNTPGAPMTSSPTVVTDPRSGRSIGSRVFLETLGHHESTAPDPPTPVIAQSARLVEPGQEVQFNAGGSSGEITRFDWDLGDGTTAAGVSATHQYDSPGEYEVTLSATGPTAEVSTTTDIVVGEGLTLLPTPDPPVAGDETTFTAVGADRYEWDLGDGTTTTGQTVFHTYDEPGTYTVTLDGDGDTVTQAVTVTEANVSIAVESGFAGTLTTGMNITTEYVLNVSSDLDLQAVTLTREGRVTEAEQRPDGNWVVEQDLSNVTGETEITFTATDTAGNTDQTTVPIGYTVAPGWLQWLRENAASDGVVTPDGYVYGEEYTFVDTGEERINALGDFAQWGDDFVFDFQAEAGWYVNSNGNYELLFEAGAEEKEDASVINIVGANLNVAGFGTGEFDGTELVSAELGVGGGLSAPIWGRTVDPPGLPEQGVEVSAQVGLEGALTINGTNGFDLTEGTVGLTGGLTGEAAVGGWLSALYLTAYGSTGGEVTLQPNLPVPDIQEIGIPVEIGFEAEAAVLWYSESVEITLVNETITLVNGSLNTDGRTVESSGWEPVDKHRVSPVPSIPETTERRSLSATQVSETLGAGAAAGVPERLTNRSLEDTQPAVTRADNSTVAAWSAQHPDRPVTDGRDIAYRVDNNGWSETAWITNDSRHDADIQLAGTDETNDLLAAWTRVDENGTATQPDDPTALYPAHEVAVAAGNESDPTDWSAPVLLSELVDSGDTLAHKPALAAGEERYLVAWERNAANSLDTYDSRSVEFALVDPTGDSPTVTETGVVENASRPAVSARANGSYDLAFYRPGPEGTAAGTVVQGIVTNGTFDIVAERSVEQFGALTVDSGRLVWSAGYGDAEQLYYDDGNGDTETLSLEGGLRDIDAIDLTVGETGSMLSYRGVPADRTTRDIIYRIERNGEWVADRRVAGTDNISVWHADTELTAGDDGFTMGYAVTEPGPDTVSDIFVTERSFTPDYAVEASGPTGATPGDTVSLGYTVRNVGVADTNPVEVVVSNGTTVVGTASLGPLGANETVSGSVEATVDESGTFEVSVESSSSPAGGEREPWLSDTARVTVATPTLAVDTVTTTATDPVTAEVRIRNDGGATAGTVPVIVRQGSTQIADGELDGIPPNGTATVPVTVDTDSYNPTTSVTVSIDRSEAAVHPNLGDRTVWLRQPELRVFEPTYRQTDAGVLARVPVANAGTADATATLSIDTDGVTVSTETVSVPTDTNSTVFETVTVPIDDGVAEGAPVRVSVDTTVPDRSPASNSLTDTFGPVFADGPPALPGREPPVDLDGDGLYQDVDGDGAFTIFDVQTFFTSFQGETVQNNPRPFNFDGDDGPEVTIFDVQALFTRLAG